MYIFEKPNFKISRGSMPPDPPSVLAPPALDTIFAGLRLPPGLLLPLSNNQYNDYVSYVRKKMFLFSAEKRVHLPYYTGLHILRTANMRSAQA